MRIIPIILFAAVLAAAPATAQDRTVFDVVEGTWSWTNGDSTCLDQQHRIKFSRDRTVMFLEYAPDSTGEATTYRYRVIDAGPGIHPGIPLVIRAELESETRTTATGEVVVWDLIVAASGNRYHWHRTDWPDLGLTNAIIRCDGDSPLEQWPPGMPEAPPKRPNRAA